MSFDSFSFFGLGVSAESSSFLRRDRLAPEARRAVEVSASMGGPSSLGTLVPGASADIFIVLNASRGSEMMEVVQLMEME